MDHFPLFMPVETLGETASPKSSFADRTPTEMKNHFMRDKYGNFWLPDAIRPSFDLQIIPKEGFRREINQDETTEENMPMLRGAVSRERLMDVFLEMLDLLGETANVILETSHAELRNEKNFQYFFREEIDIPVLKSILWDYEDFLISDGCSGIAVFHGETIQEIHLDEHKLLLIYAENTSDYEQIFIRNDIFPDASFPVITDAEHVHVTQSAFMERFLALTYDLKMEMC